MFWLVLLLIVAPIVELYVVIQVAQVIGGWQTIALLVIVSAIGAWLLKYQGLSTLQKVSEAVEAGRSPGRELVDGLLILVAGALMLVPGFFGDLVGFVLLVPFTRAPIRALLLRRFSAGRYQSLFVSGPGGARFIGTFRAGSVYDTTGTDQRREPPSGELHR